MAVEQLQQQLQAMTARLQALETTLNNRNGSGQNKYGNEAAVSSIYP